MSPLGLIFIGVLVAMFIKMAPRLFVRNAAGVDVEDIVRRALTNVPEQIHLSRIELAQWKDEAAMQAQVSPLIHTGFEDLGTYTVDKMPGLLLRILFQPETCVSAQICEHPKAGVWIEFATRYNDGSSDFLTTLPNQGITPPPFSRTVHANSSTPTDSLYQQHLQKRKPDGIKQIAPSDVIHEFEKSYACHVVWKRNIGLKPEEAAQVALRWANARKQAAGKM